MGWVIGLIVGLVLLVLIGYAIVQYNGLVKHATGTKTPSRRSTCSSRGATT